MNDDELLLLLIINIILQYSRISIFSATQENTIFSIKKDGSVNSFWYYILYYYLVSRQALMFRIN